MLREMDDAVAQAVGATTRTAGTLRINTLSMAAKKIIAPRLGRFHKTHPDVVLDIVIDDGLSDIVAGGFDAGIRVGERLQKDMIAVRLTPDVKLLAVASPKYLARRGEPKTPADLHVMPASTGAFRAAARLLDGSLRRRARRSNPSSKARSSPITRTSSCRPLCKDWEFSTRTTTMASQKHWSADG